MIISGNLEIQYETWIAVENHLKSGNPAWDLNLQLKTIWKSSKTNIRLYMEIANHVSCGLKSINEDGEGEDDDVAQ